MYSPGKNTIPYYQCTCGYKIIHLKSMQKSNIGKYKKSTKTIVFLYKLGYITCKIITKIQALLELGFAMTAKYTNGAAIASVDTEGTDGTTCYAGALTDSKTCSELKDAGVSIFETLREHDCGSVLYQKRAESHNGKKKYHKNSYSKTGIRFKGKTGS